MSGQYPRRIAAASLLLMAMSGAAAQAQKPGGVLRIYHRDSPASMSIHEEGTNSVAIPMMAVLNNLVLYDQHQAQNSLDTIAPELAESWSWNEEGTRLTFKLRERVKWHDGKPFTSADVKCTWDLLTGRASERLRLNPRKSWWNNVAEIAADSPTEATFVLKRPQPAILALLAWKAVKHLTAPGAAPASPQPVPPPAPANTGGGSGGGFGDILKGPLGGLLGGAAAGSVISGGLGDLLKQLQQGGQGDTANSWVGKGPNKAISPGDLASALGVDQIDQLSSQSGLSRDDLLKGLSQLLPQAVDHLTPDGRLPTDGEVSDRL